MYSKIVRSICTMEMMRAPKQIEPMWVMKA
jgi:hypothetical protein